MDKNENLQKAPISPAMPGVASGGVFCPDCGNSGIVGDEGPGRRNARHEWVPCDCPKGDSHRPRRIDRFQPDWTDGEMDALSDMAEAKEMSQKAVVRAAMRLYQAVHARACTVVWPIAPGEGQHDEPLAPATGSAPENKITVAGVTFGPKDVKSAVVTIDGRDIHIDEKTPEERKVGFQ